MRRKIIRVLVAHSDSTVLRYLSIEIPRAFDALGIYAHIITSKTFNDTKKMIKKENVDVFCICFNWEDEQGHGEDLIELIEKTSIHQSTIVMMENNDVDYRLRITDEYYPILCPTKEMLFSNLDRYLRKTLKRIAPYIQEVIIPTHTDVIRFYLEEVPYAYGHAGKTTIHIYDFDVKRYKTIEIPLSITNFLARYDKFNMFLKCHRDYAVNRTMIRKVRKSREDQCIELIYPNEKNYPVEIPMSDSGKKLVIKAMNTVVKGADLE